MEDPRSDSQCLVAVRNDANFVDAAGRLRGLALKRSTSGHVEGYLAVRLYYSFLENANPSKVASKHRHSNKYRGHSPYVQVALSPVCNVIPTL